MSLFLLALVGACWGAATGSFLGCAAWRIPRRISLDDPKRSHCPSCGQLVPGYRNIPIVSWLLQRGRSACCDQPMSRGYLFWELLATALGVAIALLLGPLGLLAAAVVLLAVPVTISRLTLRRGE